MRVFWLREQTLVDYFKGYRSHHKLSSWDKQSTSRILSHIETRMKKRGEMVSYDETTASVGPARIGFYRTLRVPDDACCLQYVTETQHPPNRLTKYEQGLGTFPLVTTAQYSQNLPSSISSRGGVIMVTVHDNPCVPELTSSAAYVAEGSPLDRFPWLRPLRYQNICRR
jgi:hypothetical protein